MSKFRPILSACNTPGYNLAKFLIPILEPSNHLEFTVKDFFSFTKEITKYDSALSMASLDIESLFTNIPLILIFPGLPFRSYVSQYLSMPLRKRMVGQLPISF